MARKYSKRAAVDTNDHQIGQEGVVTMAVQGAPDLKHPAVEIPDGPPSKSKLEELAFMNEVVMVEVHPSADPDEPQYVQLWNGGIIQIIPRGIPTPVKRKFVEVLARLKPINYRNEEYRDPDGNNSVRWPKKTGMRYPFSMQDTNPRGADWLRKLLAEAA